MSGAEFQKVTNKFDKDLGSAGKSLIVTPW